MNPVSFTAQAPSNIALIKYMGKSDEALNLPANPSISMTLSELSSVTELTRISESGPLRVRWVGELPSIARTGEPPSSATMPPNHSQSGLGLSSRLQVPALSESGIERFKRHFVRVAERHGKTQGEYEIRSANTFPAGAGIASSASSFASLTLAAAQAFSEDPKTFAESWNNRQGSPGSARPSHESLSPQSTTLARSLSALSREGSGSSCRSFEGPWVRWDHEYGHPLESRLPDMVDLILLIDTGEKKVSSSEAHRRIQTSPLWTGRPERARERADQLAQALQRGELQTIARIAWQECWEMHSLFHTAEEPFTYFKPETVRALEWLAQQQQTGSPPIVTLDAGPNIHVLVPAEQEAEWAEAIRAHLPGIRVLSDRQGTGARLL